MHRHDEAHAAVAQLIQHIEQAGYDRTAAFAVRLALEEAFTNAFKHGNLDDPAKSVRFDWRVDPDRIELEVQDEGPGFDPASVPDPTEQENLDIPAGRGLMLMKAYMTHVTIHPPGNRIEMIFERPARK